MKIIFDHQIFVDQRVGGISKYHTELYKNLLEIGCDADLICRLHQNLFVKEEFNNHKLFIEKNSIWIKRSMKFYNSLELYAKLNKNRDCIIHPTYYNTTLLKRFTKNPMVITVHDLTHELFFPKTDQVRRFLKKKKQTIMTADRIIAISNHTKKDLLAYYHLPEDKIDVVYHGVNNRIDLKNSYSKRHEYILFVGERQGYKNFEITIRALASLLKGYSIDLICVGGEFNAAEKHLIHQLNLESCVYSQYVSEDYLQYLYQNAILFIYPSLYEGFGLPILEAFRNDCPICISNTSCFPEIAGDAALYFDPNDQDSIQEQVRSILDNKQLRENLRSKGNQRMRNFSWEKTARTTLASYRKI